MSSTRAVTRRATYVVDAISTVTELGELTKLAAKLGYIAVLEPAEGEHAQGHQVRFERETDLFTAEELVNLAILTAFTQGKSGEQSLEQIRAGMVERHFPMDKPIQDVMEIAGGSEHEGH